MENDLIFVKIEDNLKKNLENEKRAQIFGNGRLPNFFLSGRRSHSFLNGRRPQKN